MVGMATSNKQNDPDHPTQQYKRQFLGFSQSLSMNDDKQYLSILQFLILAIKT